MASKVIQSESEYQELENQQLIINIFEKFEFNLNFINMSYEDLSILNIKLLNNEFNDVYQEIIKNNEINEKLSFIFIECINQGFSEEKAQYSIQEQITKHIVESFLIKEQEQKMVNEINQFDFINAPLTSTGIYHLPSFKIQFNL